MRIGIDCRLWNESGVGRYIRNLAEQLQVIDKNNQYVLFVLTKDRKEILNSIRQAQDRQVQNDSFRTINVDIRWHTLEEQLRFPTILNKENLDLVHFPYFSIPIFYNKPFVVTIHDLILHHFPTGEASTLPIPLYKLKLLGYKFVIKKAAQNAAKIITVSNATKKEIVDHLGADEDKVVVTYEGASINEKLKIKNEKLQLKNKKYFLYVGNAYPHKNLERLIKAFNLICHPEEAKRLKDPLRFAEALGDSSATPQNDIRLILVGKEDYFYKRLKEKVKNMGLARSVVFYGEASDEELSALYKNAKALVMPSLMEGFGLPVLEAMANKCLVLASDIPSLKEVCADAAVYFDPYDTSDISGKMLSVLHSNDINHYSGNIKKGLEGAKMFSWQKMAEDTLNIYNSLIAPN